MKRNSIEHPKVKKIARILEISISHAVGILEVLWHFTAKYAIAGDVGRFDDEEIADAVYWEGDAKKLVEALVDATWLDKSETHRLVIHDWFDHADDTVHLMLARRNEFFASGERPKIKRLSTKEREAIERKYQEADGRQEKQDVRTAGAQYAHGSALPKAYSLEPRAQGLEPKAQGQKPNKNMSSSADDVFEKQFDEIWNLWPSRRRSTKKRAKKSHQTAVKKISHDELAHSIQEYIASPRIQHLLEQRNFQYIPLLPTWLNQEGWTEDPSAWQVFQGHVNGEIHNDESDIAQVFQPRNPTADELKMIRGE